MRFFRLIVAIELLSLAVTNAAPGSFIRPNLNNFNGTSFAGNSRIVCTYFFPWYDFPLGAPLDLNYMSDHPQSVTPGPSPSNPWTNAYFGGPIPYSYSDANWHAQELKQMSDVGIDMALVFFGRWLDIEANRDRTIQTDTQIETLNRAIDLMQSRGEQFPKIALWVGTLELAASKLNLATREGREYFYTVIRDFYSRLHPSRWARIDGKVVVWLWVEDAIANTTDRTLENTFVYIRNAFAADFGGQKLIFAGSAEWANRYKAPIDIQVPWGAALRANGLSLGRDVAEVGPGYDDTSQPRRKTRVNPRRDGEVYRIGWRLARESGRKIVALETWNEFYEGTDICPSFEYGTMFYDMTARNADRFHAGK